MSLARIVCFLVITIFSYGPTFGGCGRIKSEISVMTWNVLGEYSSVFELFFHVKTRTNDWKQQKFLDVLKRIEEVRADVICLQEVSPALYADLCHSYLPYRYVYHRVKNSGVLLGYHKYLFVEQGSISSMLGGSSPGKAVSVVLYHRKMAETYVVSCVHISRAMKRFTQSLNHGRSVTIDNEDVGREQIKIVLENMACLDHRNRYAAIIAGDFNTESAEINRIASDLHLSLFEHHAVTFTTPRKSFYSIDHVLYRNMQLIEPDCFVGDRTNPFMRPYRLTGVQRYFESSWSDHVPVVAAFALLNSARKTATGGVELGGKKSFDDQFGRHTGVRDDNFSDASRNQNVVSLEKVRRKMKDRTS